MSEMVRNVEAVLGRFLHGDDEAMEAAARAAIEAMREPTSEMRIAGAHIHDQRPSEVTAVYSAMIDAALK